ncbi:MAG: hypothetical protein JEY97_02255 [Bacteroidales bacterium]|nr:hypothetical protein [Bacteroidales bacterium]
MKKIGVLLILAFSLSILQSQNVYKVEESENEVVYGKSIKLFLGDKVYIQTKVKNNKIKEFTLVGRIKDSTTTIILTFNEDLLELDNNTFLKVVNPFDKTLHYKAKIRPYNKIKYFKTSIIPIFPKIYSVEMWPYKIESIVLSGFKLIK